MAPILPNPSLYITRLASRILSLFGVGLTPFQVSLLKIGRFSFSNSIWPCSEALRNLIFKCHLKIGLKSGTQSTASRSLKCPRLSLRLSNVQRICCEAGKFARQPTVSHALTTLSTRVCVSLRGGVYWGCSCIACSISFLTPWSIVGIFGSFFLQIF